ncbi:hypothetical protein [Streptomyces sp. NPDC019937]|uniref:hypothetical protein n=1 Tax=Streptomyces sp. NPDC019937 TaxID=3154787 RepID=UPI0033F86180
MPLRDEVLVPFRGLRWRTPFIGSAVLLRLLGRLVAWAYRAARRTEEKPEESKGRPSAKGQKQAPKQAKANPKQAKAKRSAEPEVEQTEDTEKGKKDSSPKAPAAKAKSGADRLERAGIAALMLLIAWAALGPLAAWAAGVVAPYVPVAGGLLIAAWVLAAVVVAPPEETATENDQEKFAGERNAETADPVENHRGTERWLVRLVLVGVRDAVADGRKGVHLATLLESADTDWDVATLRQHCEHFGIPTKKINIRGQGSATWGVHVDQLEEVLGGSVEAALAALDATPTGGPVEGGEESPAQAEEETPVEAAARPTLARLLGTAGGPSPGTTA